jgi:hypothetical protein
MTTDRIAMRDGGKDSVLKIWGKLVASWRELEAEPSHITA